MRRKGASVRLGTAKLERMIDRIYCHVVWATRHRAPLIDAGLARFLCTFLRRVATQEGARILEIGMVRTHLHLLVRIRPTTDVSRLLQRLKGGSAAALPLKRPYRVSLLTGPRREFTRDSSGLAAAEVTVHPSVH